MDSLRAPSRRTAVWAVLVTLLAFLCGGPVHHLLASGPTTGASAAHVAQPADAMNHGTDAGTHPTVDAGHRAADAATHPAEPREPTPEVGAAERASHAGGSHCPQTPGQGPVDCVVQEAAPPPLAAVLPQPLPSLAPLAAASVAQRAPDSGRTPATPSPLFLGISRT